MHGHEYSDAAVALPAVRCVFSDRRASGWFLVLAASSTGCVFSDRSVALTTLVGVSFLIAGKTSFDLLQDGKSHAPPGSGDVVIAQPCRSAET